jgi:hypothetical protein
MTIAKKIRIAAAALFLTAFLPGVVLAAGFDTEKMIVDDGLLFTLDDKGVRKQFDGAEVVEEQTARGKIYWLAADPNADGANEGLYKGWTSGIYFFGADGKFISCLEIKDAQMSYVHFSPDAKHLVLDSGTYVDRDFKLYDFDGLKLKHDFYGASPLVWLDNGRFVFTGLDTKRGSRSEGADMPGWMSVVVYDLAAGDLVTVVEATATEDYMLDGADLDAGELVIWKYSVKNPEDWSDDEKKKTESVRAPIPSAG